MANDARRTLPARATRIRWDLGLSQLLPQWRGLVAREGLREDVLAGVIVACIAIPLSLAIALASGVPPGVGLITAIIAGIVCALWGGTPLAVSGPAAAMAVLIAAVVEQHGVSGLLIVGVGCGLLQLATGFFGLGRLIRFVPMPVVAGFTAGIGAIILIGQLPRALGLPPPDQAHVVDVVTHLSELLHQTQPVAAAVTLGSLAILFGLPRLLPRVPAALVAVVVPTAAVALWGLDVPTIGRLPDSLPAPKLPAISLSALLQLGGSLFTVYALASIETLLSSSAVDKLAKGARHDPDQEMIGQGIGNVTVALFGGIPVTGVIVRSALNVQAGARTRRSSIVHALVLLASVYFLGPLMAQIPIAALAGVLLSVALRMLHPRELITLWRASRGEALVYAITFIVIVAADLIVGVQAGIVAALVIAALRIAQSQVKLSVVEGYGPVRLSFSGPLTFFAASKLEELSVRTSELSARDSVIFDLSRATTIDASGADRFLDIVEALQARGVPVVIKGLAERERATLIASRPHSDLSNYFALTEADVRRMLANNEGPQIASSSLASRVEHVRPELQARYGRLLESLATTQEPDTLFLTCSDSRIDPNLVTGSDPGDLFIVRNIGNTVPDISRAPSSSVRAAVDFAVGVLHVRQIVVCGHSNCGAMKALLSGPLSPELRAVSEWLEHSAETRDALPPNADPDAASQRNVLVQLEHLRLYPLVRNAMDSGQLTIEGWFYDVRSGSISRWSEDQQSFVPLASEYAAVRQSPPPPATLH